MCLYACVCSCVSVSASMCVIVRVSFYECKSLWLADLAIPS